MHLFHGSRVQDLKIINKQKSTHGKEFVYALDSKEFALLFLNTVCGDFTLFIGMYDNKPYVCERYKNAIVDTFNNVNGSIYTLNRTNFLKGMTGWEPEYVSEHDEVVIYENKINNALDELLKYESMNKISIDYYPKRNCLVPQDDSDLIEKAILWYKKSGQCILDRFKKYQSKELNEILLNKLRNKNLLI